MTILCRLSAVSVKEKKEKVNGFKGTWNENHKSNTKERRVEVRACKKNST